MIRSAIKKTMQCLLGLGAARRIRLSVSHAMGTECFLRDITVLPDDVFLVSYPRSGNTWCRFLIGNVVHGSNGPVDFENIEEKVPDIYRNTNKALVRIPSPRILKSHEPYTSRYRRVILLVRDPRDVVVSYYHYHIKVRSIQDGYPVESYVTRFVSGDLDHYGSWGENVGSWLGARRGTAGFLLIRYEDLLEDTERELGRIASFLSVDVRRSQLVRAIKQSTPDRMRRLEKEQRWEPVIRESDPNRSFVRSAVAGGWKSELPPGCAAEIERNWASTMKELDYPI